VRKDLANGEILGYTVTYQLISTADEEREEEPVHEIVVEKPSVKLVNLTRFSTYKIQISAFNIIGHGPALEMQRGMIMHYWLLQSI